MSNDELIVFLKTLYRSVMKDNLSTPEFKQRVRIQLHNAYIYGGKFAQARALI